MMRRGMPTWSLGCWWTPPVVWWARQCAPRACWAAAPLCSCAPSAAAALSSAALLRRWSLSLEMCSMSQVRGLAVFTASQLHCHIFCSTRADCVHWSACTRAVCCMWGHPCHGAPMPAATAPHSSCPPKLYVVIILSDAPPLQGLWFLWSSWHARLACRWCQMRRRAPLTLMTPGTTQLATQRKVSDQTDLQTHPPAS